MPSKYTQAQRYVIDNVKRDPALAERIFASIRTKEPTSILCAHDAFEVLKNYLPVHEEGLAVAVLNRRNHVVAATTLTVGNDAHTIVDSRQILHFCLTHRGYAFIIAHNHPSGDVSPSQADVEVTSRVVQAAAIVGVECLDHLIITAQGQYISLREQGLLQPSSVNTSNLVSY